MRVLSYLQNANPRNLSCQTRIRPAKTPRVCFEDAIPAGQSKLNCNSIVQPERLIEVNGRLQRRLRIVLVSRNATLQDKRNVFCSQPYPNTNILQDFPDGWSECFIREDFEKRLLSFPQRIQRLVSRAYRIGDSPGNMFGTRKIRERELVLDERPLTLVSSAVSLYTLRFRSYDHDKRIRLALRTAYCRMPRQNKRAFDELYNSPEHDDAGRVAGIVRSWTITGYIGPKSNYAETMGRCWMFALAYARRILPHTFVLALTRYTVAVRVFGTTGVQNLSLSASTLCATLAKLMNYKGRHNSYAERMASFDHYGFKSQCLDPIVSDKTREILKGCAVISYAGGAT